MHNPAQCTVLSAVVPDMTLLHTQPNRPNTHGIPVGEEVAQGEAEPVEAGAAEPVEVGAVEPVEAGAVEPVVPDMTHPHMQ